MDRIARLGGKAATLADLREHGFPVPEFVVLDTGEYTDFVAAHELGPVIEQALTQPPAQAAQTIRAAFRSPVPAGQRERILATVGELVHRPMAVRSSATAEDLPEASFAGQQDSFLDVLGDNALLDAVLACWASLWTERALTYRARQGVPTDGLGLAVIVQELVRPEAAGVLFTADPLSGHRGRTVIDAVPGSADQLVSGQVTPEHVEVDSSSGQVLARTPGSEQILPADRVAELVDLGRRLAAHLHHPQDVEWVCRGDQVQVVQSRPITTLYPLPQADGDELALWLSFAGVQGVLGPITPLGQDVLLRLLGGAGQLVGPRPDHRTLPYLRPAGDRLWIRADRLLRARPNLVHRVLAVVDPAAAAVVRRLATEPAFTRARAQSLPLRQFAPLAVTVAPRVVRALARPDAARRGLNRVADGAIAGLTGELRSAGLHRDPRTRLLARVATAQTFLAGILPTLLPRFGPVVLPAVLLVQALRSQAAATALPHADALALQVLRAVPGNVTTEMDLALHTVARTVRADPASRSRFAGADPAQLADELAAGTLPAAAVTAVTDFLQRYGMRGVAEIDLGAPRWRDDPTPVLATLVGYLDLPEETDPEADHREGARQARAAVDRLAAALPPARARRLRWTAGRVRSLFGARETPKFTLVRGFGLLRTALLASGADLVAAGRLDRAEDVTLLTGDELRVAFDVDVRAGLDARRARLARERRRSRVPVVLLGDGRTFWSGPAEGSADLAGTGVSPGVVEGPVRVVDDPGSSGLRPGEILVCRGTDPAWTPLFLTAAGLVTEVGGLMTHGSVVAREYGLPAVVGVAQTTTRLRTGDRVRVDGTTGTLRLLDTDRAADTA